MLKKFFDLLIKFFIILSIVLSLVALVKPELIKDFLEWVKNAIHNLWYWNYLIIFLSSLIEWLPLLWIVVPWQNILLIVWWFFWEISRVNLIYVIIIASIWAILSNYLWYILWIYFWESFFKKYGLWIGIWETEVKYLKKWIEKWWAWWIIIWKFHNIARAFVPFIAWSMWMNKKTFIIYNIIWSILRAVTIVIIWVVFAAYYETIIDYIWYIMTTILFLTWLYIYKFKSKEFKQYMQEKNAEIESKMR